MVVNNPFHKRLTLKEWMDTDEYKHGQSLDSREFVEVWFNRMPIRATYIRPDVIYAPFDGVVTHVGIYDPDKDVFDVKGESYTLNEVMDTEMNCKCYACGIFLTAFSVHLGRFPVNGIVKRIDDLPPILTGNLSMVLAESDLFRGKLQPKNLSFSKYNQRRYIELYDVNKHITVIVVSIADREVDSLLDFKQEGEQFRQGQRMQFVTWGSYALLIVPIKSDRVKFDIVTKPFDYVYAGKDWIFVQTKTK